MTTALRYPWTELRRCARSAAVMIGVVLPLMAATGALLAWGVLDVRWGTAVLLGVVLAPTDPVLVSSLVAGEAAEEALPAPVRQTTSVESAGNDGVGLFFVLFAFVVVGDTSWGTFVAMRSRRSPAGSASAWQQDSSPVRSCGALGRSS